MERIRIKEMPDKETLEQFVNQGHGDEKTKVILDIEKGKFEWANERPKRNHTREK